MNFYLSCPIKASHSGPVPGKIVSPACQMPPSSHPAEAHPVLIRCRDQPGRCTVGEIDDVAVFNYFYLCFWHWFRTFFPCLVCEKPITMSTIYRPNFQSVSLTELLIICVFRDTTLKESFLREQCTAKKDSLRNLLAQIANIVFELFGVLCRKTQQLMSSHTL